MAMRLRLLLLTGILLVAACAKEGPQPEQRLSEPTAFTIRAGFAEADSDTRSRLEFGESAARVLWSQGDAFKMYRMGTSGYSQTTFTTQDDGVPYATFTTTRQLADDDSYTSIYPAAGYSVYRSAGDDVQLRIPVPPTQEAVPGGLAEGLNLAAAWTSDQNADLHFSNLLSIVRFRLSGDVSNLESVTFEAGKNVAGDATLFYQDGELHFGFLNSYSAVTYPRSTSVTLTGPFTAVQDYCIALVPTTLDGFKLLFRDARGRILTKTSSKPLTLSRSRTVDFGTVDVSGVWEDLPFPYMKQTQGRKKNVIAVLADGFRAEELALFESLAKDAVDYMFSVEPYKTYKDYFTVYLCQVASKESGAGIIDESGNILTPVDNYFGSRWPEDSYGNMTADEGTVMSYLSSHIPEVVSGELAQKEIPAVLLINDDRYGGICHIKGNGWSYAQVPYQYAGKKTIRWSFPSVQAVDVQNDSQGSRPTTDEEKDEMGRMVGDWRNTFLHEFGGHGYGRLADEYWSTKTKYTAPGAVNGHDWAVSYALNVSGYYGSVPWQADLLDHLDEWTARNPDYERIGIWHGGHSSLYYRWRSEKTSCMIDNRPYFSTWQRILIVRKIMEKTEETFDMDDFIAKDVTVDPIRPVVSATASPEERRRILRRVRSQALLVPEMPMLPPPILEDE